jgi:hypothetical protein
VNDHGDQLREAFESHEHLTPDPGAVYARVEELSRGYKRRRRGAQVAGATLVAAGVLAGGVYLPGLLPERAESTFAISSAAAPSASPAAPSEADLEKAWKAYYAAGYDYDDAVKLAEIWKSTEPAGTIKAEAGRRLLAGETLPIVATPNDPAPETSVDPKAEARLRAYFAAGYDYDDAVKLAGIWKLAEPGDAKVKAGKLLLAGKKLPVKPDPANVSDAKEEARVEAFFKAGYDVEDAQELAKIWKLDDAYSAKVAGGKLLLAGKKLPIKP